ncbi:MAG: hypothetical protein DI536_04500 [Archangium gephyra]|uniref:Uncharacterized protein n=1 Tax=Archangium gephyra TaxID=48 RepID=A0A2W5TPI0_9BACT|nr:MAG: hypothetical protein DI536_04500 [Archangium gephyra]
MTSSVVLVLLVGELSAPLRPHLERALPSAFPQQTPEVRLGAQAPPGRTVAWVTVRDSEVELVLHTARVPGDLRRTLKFAPSDTPSGRAQTIAFGLALLVREREAALTATAPPVATEPKVEPELVPVAPPAPADWSFAVAGLFSFDTNASVPGGGAFINGHRVLARPLIFTVDVGLSLEFTAQAAVQNASLSAPAAWADVRLGLGDLRVVPRIGVGAGVTVLLLSSAVTPQPLFRTALELEVKLGGPHRLVGGLAAHFTTSPLTVTTSNGNGNGKGKGNMPSTSQLGPVWVRCELGYAVAF